ncbi:hypothetical protein AVEN_184779-1 [Araneus ventricosus]|uniref:Uncharacterized protein n=1 Tax=Araneus ventricosus TaxID=182803 RepID=A0A4Y2PC67_ARAVE|nr:hypothetical protein AVEN_184779-1 [Araneus ventricosus]
MPTTCASASDTARNQSNTCADYVLELHLRMESSAFSTVEAAQGLFLPPMPNADYIRQCFDTARNQATRVLDSEVMAVIEAKFEPDLNSQAYLLKLWADTNRSRWHRNEGQRMRRSRTPGRRRRGGMKRRWFLVPQDRNTR